MINVKQEYERIVNTYGDVIYRVVYCYCKNKFDSEDILQNTFLKLYLSEQTFESDEHIKNWLYKVAINNAINVRKSMWHKYNEIPTDYPMRTEEESGIYEAVMKLPDKYRIVIVLYYYVGYSVKEIAKIINRKESTIQTQLQRGREKLEYVLTEGEEWQI